MEEKQEEEDDTDQRVVSYLLGLKSSSRLVRQPVTGLYVGEEGKDDSS